MKKYSLKNYLCGFLTALLIVALAVPSFAESTIRQLTADYGVNAIFIDGARFTPRDANGIYIQPFMVNGTTYLPIRAVAEAVGYDVKYNDATSSVTLTKKTAGATPSPTPSRSPSTNPLDTTFQSNLTTRVNTCLKVATVAYANLQTKINDYASRGMSRSSGAQTAMAAQASIKSDALVMNGMIVCIRDATTNEQLKEIETDFAYYESIY